MTSTGSSKLSSLAALWAEIIHFEMTRGKTRLWIQCEISGENEYTLIEGISGVSGSIELRFGHHLSRAQDYTWAEFQLVHRKDSRDIRV